MTVSELIAILSKVDNKTLSVKFMGYDDNTSHSINIKKVIHVNELHTQYTPQEYILIGE